MSVKRTWWKEQVIYQIYPRSFNDSNGDGVGDIPGIIEKLDYLKNLGVDIIWLSPVYESPNDDNGYDISNYYKIHPEFGTMTEFDEMLDGLHQRGMKLIMDLVVNHSSDEHKWFEESRKSKDNAYRDFYIWKKGKNGEPPNNWKSFFGGSAWEYEEETGEYYLHLFSKKQPDLNWENPKVRQEVYDNMRFWLEKGVDGFRMDVISLISKRLEFADANFKSFGECVEKMYSNDPRVHEYINEMYETVLKDYDITTVGEGPGISSKVGLDYVGADREELSMIFHLDHMHLDEGPRGRFDILPYDLIDVKRVFKEWYDAMGDAGWVSIFLDNHDYARLVSRFGNDTTYRVESAKMLAILLLTMRGTPCIYQGSEMGMTNVKFDTMDDFRDLETLNFHQEFTNEGMSETDFIEKANKVGRDNARTPMQWNENDQAGFTTGEPWIKVNPNYSFINAKAVLDAPNSIYYFYKKLLAFRKDNLTLVYGQYEEVLSDHEQLFIYRRWDDQEQYYVVLNFSDEPHEFQIENISAYQLVIGNYKNESDSRLRPWEGRLYQIPINQRFIT